MTKAHLLALLAVASASPVALFLQRSCEQMPGCTISEDTEVVEADAGPDRYYQRVCGQLTNCVRDEDLVTTCAANFAIVPPATQCALWEPTITCPVAPEAAILFPVATDTTETLSAAFAIDFTLASQLVMDVASSVGVSLVCRDPFTGAVTANETLSITARVHETEGSVTAIDTATMLSGDDSTSTLNYTFQVNDMTAPRQAELEALIEFGDDCRVQFVALLDGGETLPGECEIPVLGDFPYTDNFGLGCSDYTDCAYPLEECVFTGEQTTCDCRDSIGVDRCENDVVCAAAPTCAAANTPIIDAAPAVTCTALADIYRRLPVTGLESASEGCYDQTIFLEDTSSARVLPVRYLVTFPGQTGLDVVNLADYAVSADGYLMQDGSLIADAAWNITEDYALEVDVDASSGENVYLRGWVRLSVATVNLDTRTDYAIELADQDSDLRAVVQLLAEGAAVFTPCAACDPRLFVQNHICNDPLDDCGPLLCLLNIDEEFNSVSGSCNR